MRIENGDSVKLLAQRSSRSQSLFSQSFDPAQGAPNLNGLVYSLDDDSDSTPLYWLGILLAVGSVHALVFFCMSFNFTPPPATEQPVSVMLDDSFLNMLADPAEAAGNKPPIAAPPPGEMATVVPPKANALPPVPEAPAAVVEPPPQVATEKNKTTPKPNQPEALIQKPAALPDGTSDAKPLHEKDLAPLKPNSQTAFDEDKNTSKSAPRDAYLSDRNSTAADRGPKNLPQGDPYIDKGDTNLLKYLGKRGEGNVPATASDANSGSVKKEGAEESGDGNAKRAADFSKDVRTAELLAPRPIETAIKRDPLDEKVKPPENVPAAAKPNDEPPAAPLPSIAVRPDVRPVSKLKTQEPDPIPSDTGLQPPTKPKDVAANTVQLPTAFELEQPKRPKPVKSNGRNESGSAKPSRSEAAVLEPSAIAKELDAQAELDRFEAQLSGSNKVAAADGILGTGAKLRKGEKGHEGNGIARPGEDNAVSDVTSINLESSASELGDPRFAKKFDAKTAYIKRFARLIDGKWKADIQAHLRINMAPGTVSIRVVIRKDGILVEVAEAYRDKGVSDENVASARRAVKAAANPTADPFPPALADRESIEYTFNFLYQ